MTDDTDDEPTRDSIHEAEVTFSRDISQTVLPVVPAEWSAALDGARAADAGEAMEALASVAARYPRYLDAWAALAETAGARGEDVAAYAYARVGYHRGLDALRAAGWRGTGYVRWRDETNRGFLKSVEALRRQAAAIGETEEEERCELFLYQLDPEWGRVGRRADGRP